MAIDRGDLHGFAARGCQALFGRASASSVTPGSRHAMPTSAIGSACSTCAACARTHSILTACMASACAIAACTFAPATLEASTRCGFASSALPSCAAWDFSCCSWDCGLSIVSALASCVSIPYPSPSMIIALSVAIFLLLLIVATSLLRLRSILLLQKNQE